MGVVSAALAYNSFTAAAPLGQAVVASALPETSRLEQMRLNPWGDGDRAA